MEETEVMCVKSPIECIIEENYAVVFRYCVSRLNGDISAAEDCTQEVFLLMYKRIHDLDLTKSILPWLYRTADHVMQAYRRKNPVHESIETIPEPIDESALQESVLDALDENEKQLIISYYSGEEKEKVAQSRGLSVPALYKQISRIKQKLLKILGK